jgi:hypothetical protein
MVEGVAFSLVLVRELERDKDDRPPIMELKDILLKDPDIRWGEVGEVGTPCAELVRSKLLLDCKESDCEGETGKFGERRRMMGNDVLEIEASDVRDSNVPVRLGGGELAGVLGTESSVDDGEVLMLERWLVPSCILRDLLLPDRPLLLTGLGMYLAAQLRLFWAVSGSVMDRRIESKMKGKGERTKLTSCVEFLDLYGDLS